ncbi:MAG: hypothetical protein R3C29_17915 [Dehalococcoidia bacterium]
MFQAQMLHANGTATETAVYSPWFPRGGDNIIFAADLVAQSSGNGKIDIDLLTKNSEDTGDGTAVTSSTLSLTDPGVGSLLVRGTLEELVRFRFTLSTDADSTDWVIFRVLQPSWFNDVVV